MSQNEELTAAEILRRYAEGERDFSHCDIRDGESFRGASLPGANFSSAYVSDADFEGADLRGADFSGANVKTSVFRGADLTDVSFADAAICSADFSNSILDRTLFVGAAWYGYRLKEGDKP
jgi:uncharacterized protein YjbI with pentapeptide repeats